MSVGGVVWSVRGEPSQFAHTAGHSTPPLLVRGGGGVVPLPLEASHLGSAIITEEKPARQIAACQAVRAIRVSRLCEWGS